MTYEEITLRGIEANQSVGGIMRGGYVYQGKFYYHYSNGLNEVEANDWKSLVDVESGNGSLAWGA